MTTAIDPRVIQRIADMHAVYRMFDRAGKLLYVGMTGHVARFDNHATKRWFPCVASITLEWHDTKAAAAVNERRAIDAERPRYNIAGRVKQAKTQREPGPRSVVGDVLKVFGDDRGLYWGVLAERLAASFPDQWAGVTAEAISAQCRALGVRSVDVRYPPGRRSPVRKGCRRADVQAAVTG